MLHVCGCDLGANGVSEAASCGRALRDGADSNEEEMCGNPAQGNARALCAVCRCVQDRRLDGSVGVATR